MLFKRTSTGEHKVLSVFQFIHQVGSIYHLKKFIKGIRVSCPPNGFGVAPPAILSTMLHAQESSRLPDIDPLSLDGVVKKLRYLKERIFFGFYLLKIRIGCDDGFDVVHRKI